MTILVLLSTKPSPMMVPELLMAPTQSTFLMVVFSMSNIMPTTMMDMLLMFLMMELLPTLMLFTLQLLLIQLPMLLLIQLLLDMVSPILDKMDVDSISILFYLSILNL